MEMHPTLRARAEYRIGAYPSAAVRYFEFALVNHCFAIVAQSPCSSGWRHASMTRMHRQRQALCLSQRISDQGRQSNSSSINPKPHGAGWVVRPSERTIVAQVRSELLSCNAAKHDDIIDALGLIAQLLDAISAGNRPDLPERPRLRAGTGNMKTPAV